MSERARAFAPVGGELFDQALHLRGMSARQHRGGQLEQGVLGHRPVAGLDQEAHLAHGIGLGVGRALQQGGPFVGGLFAQPVFQEVPEQIVQLQSQVGLVQHVDEQAHALDVVQPLQGVGLA